jgi:hypothetical protein
MAVAGRASETDGRGGDAGPPRHFAHLATTARNFTGHLAGLLGFPPSQNDNRPAYREPGPAVELNCLRDAFAPSLLAAAERRSDEVGVGADRVLILWGVISEGAYLDHLAAYAGLGIETLADIRRNDCALPDAQIHLVARHGILPIRAQGELVYVSAPRGYTARRIVRLLARYPSLRTRLRLTSTTHLNEFLEVQSGDTLAQIAAGGLATRFPNLSVAPIPVSRGRLISLARYLLRLAIPAALLVLAPLTVIDVCSVVLAIWFLVFTSLRLAGCFSPRKRRPRPSRLHDSQLPVYTIVAALYREASSVAPLMQYIDGLDYPRESWTSNSSSNWTISARAQPSQDSVRCRMSRSSSPAMSDRVQSPRPSTAR